MKGIFHKRHKDSKYVCIKNIDVFRFIQQALLNIEEQIGTGTIIASDFNTHSYQQINHPD
jgi:hypothetical protein